jgi:hypothetical protein
MYRTLPATTRFYSAACTYPAAAAGAPVVGLLWAPAGAGDVLMLSAGVHELDAASHVDSANADVGASYAAAAFSSGGKPNAPLTITSASGTRAIIDGKDIGPGVMVSAPHVTLRGIEVRRGEMVIFRASHTQLIGCRIHGVGRQVALTVAYSSNVSIAQNMIFDVYFNSRAVAMQIGRGAVGVRVQRNTIASADHCVRFAGLDPTFPASPRPDVVFEANVIMACRFEAVRADKGVQLEPDNVRNNLIWDSPATGLSAVSARHCNV